jgi:hypothetical protein
MELDVMNPWMSRIILLGGLALLTAGAASAQTEESLRATIPFEFRVGQVTLPAGEYDVTYDALDAPNILTVRSQDGRHTALVLTEPIDAKAPTKGARLVFDRDGDAYQLSEVFAPAARVGSEVLNKHSVM